MSGIFYDIFIEGFKKYGAEIVCAVLLFMSVAMFPRLKRFLKKSRYEFLNKPESPESYKSEVLEDIPEEEYSSETEDKGKGDANVIRIPEWMSKKRKEFTSPIARIARLLGAYGAVFVLGFGMLILLPILPKNAITICIVIIGFILMITMLIYSLYAMYALLFRGVQTYIVAAERGDADSQLQVGRGYYGQGNYRLSYMWYCLADMCGNKIARAKLNAMENGGAFSGAKISPSEVAEAKSEAQKMYDEITQNRAAAFEYYRSKSWKGDSTAQYNLGYVYQHGEGVQQDNYTAYVWYSVAMLNGDWDAKSRLKQLESKLFPPQIAQAEAEAKRKFKAIRQRKTQN